MPDEWAQVDLDENGEFGLGDHVGAEKVRVRLPDADAPDLEKALAVLSELADVKGQPWFDEVVVPLDVCKPAEWVIGGEQASWDGRFDLTVGKFELRVDPKDCDGASDAEARLEALQEIIGSLMAVASTRVSQRAMEKVTSDGDV